MFDFNGIDQSAQHSAPLVSLHDFTIALRVRIETASMGAILGAGTFSDMILVTANAEGVGQTRIRVRGGGELKTIRFDTSSPDLYDGQTRLLLFTRVGATVRAWVDGVEQTLSVDQGNLQDETVDLQHSLAIAARNYDGILSSFLSMSAGEFAVWPYALSASEIKILANGFSPMFTRGAPRHYWQGLDGREAVGSAGWTITGVLADEHPAVVQPDGAIICHHQSPNRHGGYDVYLKEGEPATPGVDCPVKRVERTVSDLSLLAADLNLEPDKSYCISVVPFNLSGHAIERADAWIETNETGDPAVAPKPVFNVRVQALAGGKAHVRWTYDQLDGQNIADDFLIEIDAVDTTLPEPDDVVVTHRPPCREYAHVLDLAEGLYRLRVLSRLEGQAITSVSWLEFRTDASPPAQSVQGLAAV